MPITPRFTLQQTATHIVLEVHVPHIRVTGVEVVVQDGSIVHVSAAPVYLLVLNFAPYQLVDDEQQQQQQQDGDDFDDDDDISSSAAATVEPRNETVRIELEKKCPGEHWENLDLIGRLVQTRPKHQPSLSTNKTPACTTTSRWLRELVVEGGQEDVSSTEVVEPEQYDGSPQESVVGGDLWHSSGSSDNNNNIIGPAGYGFARSFHGVFTDLVRDGLAREMLEGHCALSVTGDAERRRLRQETENTTFSRDRYLEDMEIQDDYLYQCALTMHPHWRTDPATEQQQEYSFFTSDERLQLQSIPYPLLPHIPSTWTQPLLAGLVDLLFGYVYDHLLTDGEPTVESSWTVTILSTSLSWLDDFGCAGWNDPENNTMAPRHDTQFPAVVETVVRSSLRRALIYPYLRNYDWAVHCLQQVAMIVRCGVRTVLRCLLQIRRILDRSELHYLGNKLYIDPYLAWLQKQGALTPMEWNALADSIEQCWTQNPHNIKASLDLDLIRMEANLLEDACDGSDTTSNDDDDDENCESDCDSDCEDSTACSHSDSSFSTAHRATVKEKAAEIANQQAEEETLSRNFLELDLGTNRVDRNDLFRILEQQPVTKENESETEKNPLIEEI